MKGRNEERGGGMEEGREEERKDGLPIGTRKGKVDIKGRRGMRERRKEEREGGGGETKWKILGKDEEQ